MYPMAVNGGTTMLQQHKTHAVLIASYIALFNGAEAAVIAAFEKVLGGPEGRDAITLLSPIQATGTRISVVRDFLELRKGSLPWVVEALPSINTIAECAGFRNRLAHSIYVEDGSNLLVVDRWVGQGKTRSSHLTIEELKSEYDKLDYAAANLVSLTGFGVPLPRQSSQ